MLPRRSSFCPVLTGPKISAHICLLGLIEVEKGRKEEVDEMMGNEDLHFVTSL